MSNFKKGDQVQVHKLGTFDGSTGTITSLLAKVNLGQAGEWTFNFDEISSLEKQVKEVVEKVIAETDKPKKAVKETKVKRPYNKRIK